MFDSHAHIGDISYKNGLICTSFPQEVPKEYTFRSVGIISEGYFNISSDENHIIEMLESFLPLGYHIGEIGLDKRYPNIELQTRIFESALSLAKKYNRFVSIHMVGFPELTYEILKKMKIDNFLLHGYTSSFEMAKRFIALGGLISLSPRAIKAKSFDKLLTLPFVTETDMAMSEEENNVLQEWNLFLSNKKDEDISKISERVLLERLNG